MLIKHSINALDQFIADHNYPVSNFFVQEIIKEYNQHNLGLKWAKDILIEYFKEESSI